MKLNSIIKDTLMLFAITLVLGVILSVAKVYTQKSIDAANLAAKLEAFNEVCPGYSSSDNIEPDVVGASAGYNASLYGEDSILRCKNASGEIIGYIVQTTSRGYGGPLNIIVGFDKTGNITGVRYATVPEETPGLGMKSTQKSFLDSWLNHNSDNVDEVDGITGATITSDAFRQAMNLACMFANRAVTLDGGV